MKQKYLSPSIKVEELNKADVLCASTETDFNSPDNGQMSLLDFASWWN